MSTRAPHRRRRATQRQTFRIWEAVGAPERVDREAAVLKHVKILGPKSANGRLYTEAAIKGAAPLYEGAKVRINHPIKADEPRQAEDVFGWLRNVAVASDGCLYGDLHYLKSHPLAERIVEAAERNPSLYGLSHNVEAEVDHDGDLLSVTRIVEVKSVDLVADPATTHGLFEQRQQRHPMKLREYLDAAFKKAPAKLQSRLTKLLEMDGEDEMAVMDDEAPAAPAADGDWRAALAAVVGQLVASEDPEAHDLAGKISKLLKPESAEPPAMEAEGDEEEDEEKPVAEACDDEKKPTEGKRRRPARKTSDPAVRELQEQLAAMKTEKEAAELRSWIQEQVAAKELPADKPLLESLFGMGDRDKITAHLDYLQKLGLKVRRDTSAPRSHAPGSHRLAEATGSEAFEGEYRNVIQRLTGRRPTSAAS